MPTFTLSVISRHTLHDPKQRRQVFYIQPGQVTILKWEGSTLVGTEVLDKPRAKGRYRFLLGLGYTKRKADRAEQDAIESLRELEKKSQKRQHAMAEIDRINATARKRDWDQRRALSK